MTEHQFIQEINNELTVSGSLPIQVPESEILRIIGQEARYFWDNWRIAVETDHYVIEKTAFTTAQFKKSKTVILPVCVESVVRVQEINGLGRLGNIDRDFAEDRLIASEIFLSSFHGDDLVLRTAQYQYFDLAKSFFLDQITYDYNRNTKQLKFLGRDPRFDVYVEVYTKIPLDKLYDDYYFLRWVTCKVKFSFARLIGTYKLPLPAGVEIDYEALRSEATEELTEIKERMNAEEQPDWFFIFH